MMPNSEYHSFGNPMPHLSSSEEEILLCNTDSKCESIFVEEVQKEFPVGSHIEPEQRTKRCTNCKYIKLLIDFNKSKKGFMGLMSYCKACDTIRKAEHIRRKKLGLPSVSQERKLQQKAERLKTGVGYKTCTHCGESKPAFEFDSSSSNVTTGLSSHCKTCRGIYFSDYRNRKKQGLPLVGKLKEEGPCGRFNSPDYDVRRTRLKRYGITLEDYQALFNKQSGCCAICGKHQLELKRSLSVGHNHETGKVRGLLCDECNFGIGKFKDNTELLTKAIEYLKTDI